MQVKHESLLYKNSVANSTGLPICKTDDVRHTLLKENPVINVGISEISKKTAKNAVENLNRRQGSGTS